MINPSRFTMLDQPSSNSLNHPRSLVGLSHNRTQFSLYIQLFLFKLLHRYQPRPLPAFSNKVKFITSNPLSVWILLLQTSQILCSTAGCNFFFSPPKDNWNDFISPKTFLTRFSTGFFEQRNSKIIIKAPSFLFFDLGGAARACLTWQSVKF